MVCVPNGVVFMRPRDSTISQPVLTNLPRHCLVIPSPDSSECAGRAGGLVQLAFVSRLTSRKGTDLLIDSLKLVPQILKTRKGLHRIAFHVFGDGSLFPQMASLSSHNWVVVDYGDHASPEYDSHVRKAIANGCIFTPLESAMSADNEKSVLILHGTIGHIELMQALRFIDVAIQASQTEAFNLASVESLDSGCRLVATPVGIVAADTQLLATSPLQSPETSSSDFELSSGGL